MQGCCKDREAAQEARCKDCCEERLLQGHKGFQKGLLQRLLQGHRGCPKGLLQGHRSCPLLRHKGCPKACCKDCRKDTEAAHCPKGMLQGVARTQKLPKRLAARAAASKQSLPKGLLQGMQRLPTAQRACCKDCYKNYCKDSALLKKLAARNCKDTEAAQKACCKGCCKDTEAA